MQLLSWFIFVQANTRPELEKAIVLYSKLSVREQVLHSGEPQTGPWRPFWLYHAHLTAWGDAIMQRGQLMDAGRHEELLSMKWSRPRAG